MEYIITFIALVMGGAIGYLAQRGQLTALQARLDMMARDNTRLADEQQQQQQLHERQTESLRREHDAEVRSLRDDFDRQLAYVRTDAEKRLESARREYSQMLLEQREQQREQLGQQMRLVREQMTVASEQILKSRADELSQTNVEQLAAILGPLRTEITQMKETVDKSGREHSTSMERLDASIKANMKQANLLSVRADRLANALTGDNKQQGNFGELRLKQLLEDMGLEEGTQFEEQATMRDEQGRPICEEEEGHRLIPAVQRPLDHVGAFRDEQPLPVGVLGQPLVAVV